MENNHEIDPIKVRAGLFALITARLEDAHELAIKGQSAIATENMVADHLADIRSVLDELNIQLDAVKLVITP